jgi:hypothetical protein
MTAFINVISIPEFIFERTWWRLFQKRVVNVPDGGYSRNASWTYLMEVIPETRRERTWWRLFQKRVVRTKFNIYFFLLHVIAIDKFIVHHNKQLKYTKKSLKIPKG